MAGSTSASQQWRRGPIPQHASPTDDLLRWVGEDGLWRGSEPTELKSDGDGCGCRDAVRSRRAYRVSLQEPGRPCGRGLPTAPRVWAVGQSAGYLPLGRSRQFPRRTVGSTRTTSRCCAPAASPTSTCSCPARPSAWPGVAPRLRHDRLRGARLSGRGRELRDRARARRRLGQGPAGADVHTAPGDVGARPRWPRRRRPSHARTVLCTKSTTTPVRTDSDAVAGDRVIPMLLPTLAGRLRYDWPLPARRDQLTQRLPGGSVIKFHVVYERSWWRHRSASTPCLGTARRTAWRCRLRAVGA